MDCGGGDKGDGGARDGAEDGDGAYQHGVVMALERPYASKSLP